MDKQTLHNHRAMELEIQQLSELIDMIDNRIHTVKTTRMTLTPKGGGFSNDSLSSSIARLESLRTLYNEKWDLLIDTRAEIELSIGNLEPQERLLIRYRYIDGLDWKDVSKRLNYSYRHTTRLHGEILKKLSKK